MKADDEGRCIALSGTMGESVGCSIYENRPQACRAYVAGAGQCEIARLFTFGVKPGLTELSEPLKEHSDFYDSLKGEEHGSKRDIA